MDGDKPNTNDINRPKNNMIVYDISSGSELSDGIEVTRDLESNVSGDLPPVTAQTSDESGALVNSQYCKYCDGNKHVSMGDSSSPIDHTMSEGSRVSQFSSESSPGETLNLNHPFSPKVLADDKHKSQFSKPVNLLPYNSNYANVQELIPIVPRTEFQKQAEVYANSLLTSLESDNQNYMTFGQELPSATINCKSNRKVLKRRLSNGDLPFAYKSTLPEKRCCKEPETRTMPNSPDGISFLPEVDGNSVINTLGALNSYLRVSQQTLWTRRTFIHSRFDKPSTSEMANKLNRELTTIDGKLALIDTALGTTEGYELPDMSSSDDEDLFIWKPESQLNILFNGYGFLQSTLLDTTLPEDLNVDASSSNSALDSRIILEVTNAVLADDIGKLNKLYKLGGLKGPKRQQGSKEDDDVTRAKELKKFPFDWDEDLDEE